MKIALILFIFLLYSAGAAGKTVEKVLSIVHGDMITLLDVKEAQKRIRNGFMDSSPVMMLFKKSRLIKKNKETLKFLIFIKTLDHFAEENKTLKAGNNEIQKEINSIIKQKKLNKRTFSTFLIKNGFSSSSYRKFLKKSLLRSRFIQTTVSSKALRISDQDLNAYSLKTTGQRLFKDFEYTLSSLLFPLTKTGQHSAKNIYEKLLKDPELFNEWDSRGAKTAKKEHIGKTRLTQLAPPIKEKIKDLSIGEISPPLASSDGYRIFKVTWKSPIIKNTNKKQKLLTKLYKKLFKEELKAWLDRHNTSLSS